MKILMINTTPIARNGITNVIFNLIEHMNAECVIDIVAINKPDRTYKKRLARCGGRFYIVSRSMRSPIRYVLALKRIIKINKYDIVHIHANSHTAVLELLAAKIAGVKVRIVHAHSTNTISKLLHKVLTPIFNLLCTTRFACGDKAGKFMFEKKKFTVINNGIDVEKYAFSSANRDFIRKKLKLQNAKVLGHVGEFNYIKNQTFLLDILKILTENSFDYHLLLIGEGDLLKQCQDKAVQLNIENKVTFVGSTNEVEKYLSACDLIIMPSLFEGVPLTLIESQANGLHCIVSNTISEEVDKTGNIDFVPLDDSGKWKQMIQAVDLNIDRESSSRKAISSIVDSGFSIQKEAERLLQRYKSLINM